MGILGFAQDNGYFGIGDTLTKAHLIGKHFQKAAELGPQDAEAQHCLGQFNFSMASLPFFERKGAALIGLSGSFENALAAFLKSSELNNDYNANSLMLAKVYQKLGKKKESKEWVDRCLALVDKDEDDTKVRKEAEELKKKLG